MTAIWKGAHHDNYGIGRLGYKVEAIVIHLMDGTLAGTDSWFNASLAERQHAQPGAQVSSAHYGIGKDGSLHQYVQEPDRAFHAGRVQGQTWKNPKLGVINTNHWTIGIEHEGHPGDEWPDAMYRASAELVAQIAGRYGFAISRDTVVGHHEIFAPKVCPGPNADLNKLVTMAQQIGGGA